MQKLECDLKRFEYPAEAHKCSGEVRKVFIREWGIFTYCQSAVEDDIKNGLSVIDLKNMEG